jgi:hypothetical protein
MVDLLFISICDFLFLLSERNKCELLFRSYGAIATISEYQWVGPPGQFLGIVTIPEKMPCPWRVPAERDLK